MLLKQTFDDLQDANFLFNHFYVVLSAGEQVSQGVKQQCQSLKVLKVFSCDFVADLAQLWNRAGHVYMPEC